MKEVLGIILTLLKWYLGSKALRAQRAREIAELFEKVTMEGDSLSEQVRTQLNKRSDLNWDDINIRSSDNNKEV